MSVRGTRLATAMTLVEVMLATVVLVIAATGALSFEHHTARHTKIARAQISGTRTARLLLEDWMSTGGSSEYDPAALGLGFSANGDTYAVTVDGVPMLVTLAWKDVDYDATAEITLRRLDVTVRFKAASQAADADRLEKIRPVVLTTYVRTDASGG